MGGDGSASRSLVHGDASGSEDKADQVEDYSPSAKNVVFISMGRKYATGQIGSWKLQRWMVSWPQGRSLFVRDAPAFVNGKT